MARWKLMTPHYLNVDGEEWEYQETDRQTGRPRGTKFRVPRLLDPSRSRPAGPSAGAGRTTKTAKSSSAGKAR